MYKKYVKRLLFLAATLWSLDAFGDKIIKVAVIDTGLKQVYRPSARLCNTGHKDFTGEGLEDYHGHGTNIVGLIVNNADAQNYCIVIIKAYGKKGVYYNQALQYAYDIKADIINLSGGGAGEDPVEKQIVLKLLDRGTTLIFAAGNDKRNLDKNCYYYPACYDSRIFVVGSKTTPHISNYGSIVDIMEDGDYQTAFGETFNGTSQATANFTAKVIREAQRLQKEGFVWGR